MAVTWWMPSGFVFISLTPFPSVYCIPLSSVDDLAPEDPQSCVDAICPAAGQEQSACNGYEDQVELVKAACGEEAVLQVHLDYRDDHHHAEGQRRQRRQEARYHQYSADELRQPGQDAIGLVGFVPSRSWNTVVPSIPGPPKLRRASGRRGPRRPLLIPASELTALWLPSLRISFVFIPTCRPFRYSPTRHIRIAPLLVN